MPQCETTTIYADYARFERTVLGRCGKLGPHYRHSVSRKWQKPLICLEYFRENYVAGYEPQLTPGQTEFGPGTTLYLPRGFVGKHLSQRPWRGFSRDTKGIRAKIEIDGQRIRKRFESEIEAQTWYKMQREKLVHNFANDPKSKLNYQTKTYLLTWRFDPPKCW